MTCEWVPPAFWWTEIPFIYSEGFGNFARFSGTASTDKKWFWWYLNDKNTASSICGDLPLKKKKERKSSVKHLMLLCKKICSFSMMNIYLTNAKCISVMSTIFCVYNNFLILNQSILSLRTSEMTAHAVPKGDITQLKCLRQQQLWSSYYICAGNDNPS